MRTSEIEKAHQRDVRRWKDRAYAVGDGFFWGAGSTPLGKSITSYCNSMAAAVGTMVKICRKALRLNLDD